MKNRENEKEKEKRKRKDRKRGSREAGGNREDVAPFHTVIGLNGPNSLPPSLVELNALDYLLPICSVASCDFSDWTVGVTLNI